MVSWWEIYRSSTLLRLKLDLSKNPKTNIIVTISNNYLFLNIKQLFNIYNNIVIKWIIKYEFIIL